MPNPPRRINDAQVERLLAAMKRDPKYRSDLAKRVVEREGLRPGTKDYARRYKSTMRRFQRYITEAGERRSFARSKTEYQRELRQQARAVPPPRELPPPPRVETTTVVRDTEPLRDVHLNDLRAIFAYHDGDLEETVNALRLSARGLRLVDLAVSGQGVSVFSMQGGGELQDAIREFYESVDPNDYQDIQDFHDLLMDLPDWQIGMILGDIEDGETTFADWMDAWREDGMSLEAQNSQYWALWRAVYARSKKA